jgi:hypothetical protein
MSWPDTSGVQYWTTNELTGNPWLVQYLAANELTRHFWRPILSCPWAHGTHPEYNIELLMSCPDTTGYSNIHHSDFTGLLPGIQYSTCNELTQHPLEFCTIRWTSAGWTTLGVCQHYNHGLSPYIWLNGLLPPLPLPHQIMIVVATFAKWREYWAWWTRCLQWYCGCWCWHECETLLRGTMFFFKVREVMAV